MIIILAIFLKYRVHDLHPCSWQGHCPCHSHCHEYQIICHRMTIGFSSDAIAQQSMLILRRHVLCCVVELNLVQIGDARSPKRLCDIAHPIDAVSEHLSVIRDHIHKRAHQRAYFISIVLLFESSTCRCDLDPLR
jgi:hypothetical protein